MRDYWVEELPASIRSLYPRWDLLGRPALPASLRAADLVHATNPAAIPPAGDGQRLVVTVHDLAFEHVPNLFPRAVAPAVPRRAPRRCAARRRDHHARRGTRPRTSCRARDVDPRKLHVVPLAASLPRGALDAEPRCSARLKVRAPYVLFVGTLEPRKNLVRLVRAYRRVAANGVPHALVLAGPLGWQPEALMRELALRGTRARSR